MDMEYLIGGVVLGLWISIGFGTRAVFRSAEHSIAEFPLLPIVWPIALLVAAYVPSFTE